MKKLVIYSALFALSMGSALAGEKEDAMKLVGDAATAASKDKAGTIAEISKATGRYVKGELYVFAYDLNGVMVAHPINPKLIGKNLRFPDLQPISPLFLLLGFGTFAPGQTRS